MFRKRVLALLLALMVSITAAATVSVVAAQAQEEGQTQQADGDDEQGFDKWGQLLGLAGLAGPGGLALQRTDEKDDDNR